MKAQIKSGFTMVEMLAVVTVIAILIALVIPNGIFFRTTSEEVVVRTQAAALELAMGQYHMTGGQAAREGWAVAYADDPSVQSMAAFLSAQGALSPQNGSESVADNFQGYAVTMPGSLKGRIKVDRESGGQVYP